MSAISRFIDHSLLRPEITEDNIVQLCDEAKKHDFFAVCVHPFFIKTAREFLCNTQIKIATVIAFPQGMSFSGVKIYEAIEAMLNGADELDVVMNVSLAKSNKWGALEKELSDVITATPGVVHKIIIETCYLTDEEKRKASIAAVNAGAEFIKTSTGFGPGGAMVGDVELIRSVTGGKTGIKAAGGIKTLKDMMALIHAGATRIGTSSGVAILKEAEKLGSL